MVSYLPAAHVADRVVAHYAAAGVRGPAHDVPRPRVIIGYLPDVRPTTWGSVPRIWEKLKAALEAGIDAGPTRSSARRRDGRSASACGRCGPSRRGRGSHRRCARSEPAPKGRPSTIRERLGLSEAEQYVVGAAPTPPEVLKFFHALGMPICELWGMSETCRRGHPQSRRPHQARHVGPAAARRRAAPGRATASCSSAGRCAPARLPHDAREDAELSTPTAGCTPATWAEIDDDGYVRIVDRKKELIINAAGKNMSPANIESPLKSASPLIGQACVVGDRRPYNVALIVLTRRRAPPSRPSTTSTTARGRAGRQPSGASPRADGCTPPCACHVSSRSRSSPILRRLAPGGTS